MRNPDLEPTPPPESPPPGTLFNTEPIPSGPLTFEPAHLALHCTRANSLARSYRYTGLPSTEIGPIPLSVDRMEGRDPVTHPGHAQFLVWLVLVVDDLLCVRNLEARK